MSAQSGTAALLFGRRTHDDLVGHWLTTPEPNPFADILRATTKYVASRTADLELRHPNSVLLQGDLETAVARVKDETDGDVVVLGSGDVVRQLAAAALVDRYLLTILPVVLGNGARLFDDTGAELAVSSSSTSRTGIVTAAYDVRPR